MHRVALAMSAIENCAVSRTPLSTAFENIKAIAHTPPAPTWLFTLAAAAGAAAMAAIFGAYHQEAVVPIMVSAAGVADLAYTNELPSGYSERMLLAAPLVLPVPNGLDARRAALTEPMAVGLHAVNRSGIVAGDGAVVIGCGPVGIAVIAALRLRGIEPIVAADLSPMRRSLATTMGAHQVIDAAHDDVFDAWVTHGGGRPLVVFEAVGVPGVIDSVFRSAPGKTRIVVVGVCMGGDRVTPFWGITKELSVQFVFAYDLDEFSGSLHAIAEGEVDVEPMITGEVGLDGVAGAFEDLGRPDRHCKILVTA